MSYESITEEMAAALTDKIEAIKEGGGGSEICDNWCRMKAFPSTSK